MTGRGGERRGSGRKSHGYKTVVRRVPVPLIPAIDAATAVLQQAQKLPPGALFPALSPIHQALPLFAEAVPMGFPSPAEGYIERRLDLNEFLIRNPTATFFLRATGDSLRDLGILEGNFLVVDRSAEPRNGDVVVAVVEGEFTAKVFFLKDGVCELRPANPDYKPIPFPQTDDDQIIGVVLWVLHDVRAR
jgi:DNA polymerase V